MHTQSPKRGRSPVWITAAGAALVAAGAVMVTRPGPGLIVLLAGIALVVAGMIAM